CDQVLCLNRWLRCSGSPDHTLSPERLSEIYDPNAQCGSYRQHRHG
ncbi:MAG TPA: ABC transporter ATP-binding protein, partial [Synechococcus sp. UBA8638]|nr:ABC transporter ATP-binding protein [Synechococcus sp. UBA8638]